MKEIHRLTCEGRGSTVLANAVIRKISQLTRTSQCEDVCGDMTIPKQFECVKVLELKACASIFCFVNNIFSACIRPKRRTSPNMTGKGA